MTYIKSEREIILMKQAGKITAKALEEIKKSIRPGVSTKELDDIAKNVIEKSGAKASFLNYKGFPASICTSMNSEVIHGIPSKNAILKEGDIISIDIGSCYKGYHADMAATYPVGKINLNRQKIIDVTKESLYFALSMIKEGVNINLISSTINEYISKHGYKILKGYQGHGIGSSLHEDPRIPNEPSDDNNIILKAGMTLAIEPMVVDGSGKSFIIDNEWTVVTKEKGDSAHFEHTIVVTRGGYEILTKIEENNG